MAKKRREEQEGGKAETDLSVEAGELRVYELGFHLDPELASEEVKKAYETVRSLIAEKGGIVAEGEPEKVALAYTISRQGHGAARRRDFDSAYFCWIAYEAPAEQHAEVISAAARESCIIRFIDLATDKESARAALERHELAAKGPAEQAPELKTEARADDAALDAALASATI